MHTFFIESSASESPPLELLLASPAFYKPTHGVILSSIQEIEERDGRYLAVDVSQPNPESTMPPERHHTQGREVRPCTPTVRFSHIV